MARTQAEKMWLTAASITGVLMVIVGWFLLIGPQRDHTTQVGEEAVNVQMQRDVTQQKISALAADTKNLDKYQQQLREANLALPADSGMPTFLRNMQTIGDATATDVISVSVGDPSPANSAVAVAPTSAAPTSSAASSASTAPAGALPVGVYALPISAQVDGTLPRLREFLTQLQQVQPRAVLISQAVFQDSTTGQSGVGELDLTMQAFVAPPSPDTGLGTTAPVPTASPTTGSAG